MEITTLDIEDLDPASLQGVTIWKHNDLIEAKYKIQSLREQQIILMLLAQIKPNDEDFRAYRISVVDFAKVAGIRPDSVYSQLDSITLALRNRAISLRKGKSFLHMGWLSSAKYIHGSGYVELCFDPNLKPYLLQLKSHFTQFALDKVLSFKSIYAIRLYELLKKEAQIADKYKKTKHFEKAFSYLELRELFGIDKKGYKLFADFKRKAIQPAVIEICDKTDLNIVDVVYGKTGRAVSKITFSVDIREKADGDIRAVQIRLEDQPKESKKEELKARLQELGYSPEYASRDVNKYGIHRIERSIAYTLAMQKAGEVKNFPAYLSKTIEGDLGGAWEQAIVDKKEKEEKIKQEALEQKRIQKQQQAEKDKESDGIIDNFFLLDQEDRETLIREFLDSLIPQMRRFSENAVQEQGEEAVRNHRPTKALFLAFMKSQR